MHRAGEVGNTGLPAVDKDGFQEQGISFNIYGHREHLQVTEAKSRVINWRSLAVCIGPQVASEIVT